MIVESISGSYLKYDDFHGKHTKDYYLYCIDLIKNYLRRTEKRYNIIFGNFQNDFENTNITIKLDIQPEHTLVKYGGRSVDEVIYGNTKHKDGTYLVRIDKFDYLNKLDLIIEYSLSNYDNISESGKFQEYIKKIVYIPPLIYDINLYNSSKSGVISLFCIKGNERRLKIFNQLSSLNIKYTNINNVFCKNELLNIYTKSKIMVNIHQTDHHHTFEELRVLPALLNGVIIISETSAFTKSIPYNEYIIWCDYDEIKQKTEDVYNNYEIYYNKIFGDGKLKNILENMKFYNLSAFDKYLS